MLRRTPLNRGGSLKRGKPINNVSERRKLALYEYGKKRKKFLAARPVCECCKKKPSRDVHHKKRRHSGGLLDETTWCALCRQCHMDVHARPKEAREAGFLV